MGVTIRPFMKAQEARAKYLADVAGSGPGGSLTEADPARS
jgi:hypothetical protein